MDVKPVATLPYSTPSGAERPVAAPAQVAQSTVQSTEPAGRVQQPAGVPDIGQMSTAIENINKMLRESMPPQKVEFSLAEDSRVIVQVIDQETKEVLRQIPSKEVLEIAKALDATQGLLIRQKV